MNVISFKAARSRLRPGPSVRPPSALISAIPEAARANAVEHVEDRARMRQNLIAAAAIACIVVLGTWLIDSLRAHSKVQMCLEAGHRNCIPIDHKYQPARFEVSR